MRVIAVLALVALLGGCDRVFLGDRPAIDASIDATIEIDAPPRCPQDAPTFGVPSPLLPGVFSPIQTVIGVNAFVVPEGEVYAYAADDGSVGMHAYNVLASWGHRVGAARTHAGYLTFMPALAQPTWPRLWRDASGQLRMFVEANGQRHLATAIDAFQGTWSQAPFTESVGSLDLPTDHIAGLALGGARVIVSREADHTIVELERDRVTGELRTLPTTEAINASGGGDHPSITSDGCWLLFDRPEDIQHELWIAIRGNDDSFGAPVKVFGSSTADDETWPALSEDGATLFYSSWIPGSSNYEKPTVRTRQ